METKYIIIAAVVAVIVIAVVVVLLVSKNKKNKQANEPIHKEYDESIANVVNEGAQADPVQSTFEQPQIAAEPAPVAEPTPVSVPVAPVNPVEPVAPTPVVAEPVAVTPTPVVQEEPKFMNVGMVAEPIIDTPKPAPVVEEPKPTFVQEVTEPVVVEESKPEVAAVSEAPTMQNYELELPEPEKMETIDEAMAPQTPEKKGPMFVTEVQEEKVENPIYKEEIQLDVPDFEDGI